TFTAGKDEVGRLYVTWDATNLYLGYDFAVEQAAVMYLVSGTPRPGGRTGATDLCYGNMGFGTPSAAFASAASTSEPVDVLVGHFGAGQLFGFQLNNGVSSADAGIVAARAGGAADGTPGTASVAIPWSSLFPGSATTVPVGAVIKIVGVVRGQQDGDL